MNVEKYLANRPLFEIDLFKKELTDRKFKFETSYECNDVYYVEKCIVKIMTSYASRLTHWNEIWKIEVNKLVGDNYEFVKSIKLDCKDNNKKITLL